MKKIILLAAVTIFISQNLLQKAHAAEERISRNNECAALERGTRTFIKELNNARVQANKDFDKYSTLPDGQEAFGEPHAETLDQLLAQVTDRRLLIHNFCANQIQMMSSMKTLGLLKHILIQDKMKYGYEAEIQIVPDSYKELVRTAVTATKQPKTTILNSRNAIR